MAGIDGEPSRIRDVVRYSKILRDIPSKLGHHSDSLVPRLDQPMIKPRHQLEYDTHRAERGFPRVFADEIGRGCYNRESTLREKNRSYFRSILHTYSGSPFIEDVWDWIDDIQDYFEEMKPPERLRCKLTAYTLDGAAEQWWQQLQHQRALNEWEVAHTDQHDVQNGKLIVDSDVFICPPDSNKNFISLNYGEYMVPIYSNTKLVSVLFDPGGFLRSIGTWSTSWMMGIPTGLIEFRIVPAYQRCRDWSSDIMVNDEVIDRDLPNLSEPFDILVWERREVCDKKRFSFYDVSERENFNNLCECMVFDHTSTGTSFLFDTGGGIYLSVNWGFVHHCLYCFDRLTGNKIVTLVHCLHLDCVVHSTDFDAWSMVLKRSYDEKHEEKDDWNSGKRMKIKVGKRGVDCEIKLTVGKEVVELFLKNMNNHASYSLAVRASGINGFEDLTFQSWKQYAIASEEKKGNDVASSKCPWVYVKGLVKDIFPKERLPQYIDFLFYCIDFVEI